MKKRSLILLGVLILAFSLRYFRIADFPKTLYGDEQAFAWNAYNILKSGTDEYGTPYPLQFRSFDDYKAPIPVYLLVPFFKILGMNAYSIRLPIVLASFLTVVVFYYFCRLKLTEKMSLLAAFLFTVSPWHIHLSRGYFESTLALLFFLSGIYFYFRSNWRFTYLIVSAIFFAASLYSYFTPRILLPVFIPFLLIYSKISRKSASVFLLTVFVLSLPLLKLTFFDKGFSRFNKLNESVSYEVIKTVNLERNASSLNPFFKAVLHNKATVWLRLLKNNYLEHFSWNFWYIYGDNSLRYFLGNMGMFYLFELPFLMTGIIFLLRTKKELAYFLFAWLLLAPIPASIVGRSFAVRSLSMLPAPFVLVSAGIYQAINNFNNHRLQKLIIFSITALVVCSLTLVLTRYYFEYPVYAATWWGWENKAAIDYAKEREDMYDRIFISDFYTGAPLAFAVYNSLNPSEFRSAVNNPVTLADNRHLIKLGKYYFGSLDLNVLRLKENIIPPKSLYIGRPEEPASNESINAPGDNRLIFNIYKTD